MPLDKSLHMNQSVLVSCVLCPVCVHMFNDCKENMFVCPLGEEKDLLFRGLSEHIPFGEHY